MKTTVVFGACMAVVLPCHALENGSFEEADRSYFVFPGVQLPPDLCLPGWNPGNVSGPLIYAEGFSRPGAILLYDDKAREEDTTGLLSTLPIAGDIALGVIPYADLDVHGQTAPPPYVEQTSLVPVGAKSLWFLWKGEQLKVSINGNSVPFHLAEQRLTDDPFVPVHDYYAADIGTYAGDEVALRFEFYPNALHGSPPWPGAVQALDDIYFSSIPEPGTLALFGLGAGWLLLRRRRRKHVMRRHPRSRRVGASPEET